MHASSNVTFQQVTRLGTTGRIAAWLLWGLSLLMSILAFVLSQGADFLFLADLIATSFVTGTIGLVILLRSSNRHMGWLLLAIGAWGTLGAFSGQYAEQAFLINPSATHPLKWPAAWITSWGWFPFLAMVFMVLPQVFPTGGPMPNRWRTIFRITLGYIVLFTIVLAFGRTPLVLADTTLPNPYGFIPIDQFVDAPGPETVVTALLLGSLGVSGASVAIRYRRSRGNERQQIKWVAFALGLLVGSFALGAIFSIALEGDCCTTDAFGPVFDLLGILAFLALPAAIGISILRYRLYDIDRIIRRTLTYALLTAVLAITYFVGVLLIQQILPAQSQFAIVFSTLAIAALFSPLRRRIQSTIDRRFYRNRYDPGEALAAFSADLRKQLDSEEITSSMMNLIDETVQPTHASIWIRNP